MYHISSDGTPRVCRAKIKCPLGAGLVHFEDQQGAATAFENEMHAKTVLGKKKYSTATTSTGMHTDITEGGAQTLVILQASGFDPDLVNSSEDLARAISRLPRTTQSFDQLQLMSAKLYNLDPSLEDSAVSKIREMKTLAREISKLLAKEGFTKEEVTENLRWMGTEDAKSTVGDIGLGGFEISIKASGSLALNNTHMNKGSRVMGVENGSLLDDLEIVALEGEILHEASGLMKKKIRESEDGKTLKVLVNKKERTWETVSEDGEDYLVYSKDDGKSVKTWKLPVKSMDNLDEWKKLTGLQQQALSSFITGHEKELKAETKYGALVDTRTKKIAEKLTESFGGLDEQHQKEAVGKFIGLRPGKSCAYVSVLGDSSTVAKTPSLEEFSTNGNIRVYTNAPHADGTLVILVNEETKEYSSMAMRGRYRDGQLNYTGASVTSEYNKVPGSARKAAGDAVTKLEAEGYSFGPLPSAIFGRD